MISAHRRASTGGRSLPTRDLRQGHSCSQRSRRRQPGSQLSSGPPRQTRICAASVGICDIPELEAGAAFTARGVPLQIKLLFLVFLLLLFFSWPAIPGCGCQRWRRRCRRVVIEFGTRLFEVELQRCGAVIAIQLTLPL